MLTITFRALVRGQAAVESGKSVCAARRYGRGMAVAKGVERSSRIGAAAAVAVAASLFAASGALAENCVLGVPLTGTSNLAQIGSSPAVMSSMIASTITSASTAFLLQSSSFIGSPPNPAPDQQGGGIWVRGVGGNVDVKSVTNTAVSSTGNIAGGGVVPASSSTVACSQQVNQTFVGVQFGADIAKLNVGGWNFHSGVTAGDLSARSSLAGGAFAFTDGISGLAAGGGSFTGSTEVPFIGVYVAATKGGFAFDALLRAEYYQTNLNGPGVNIFNQNIDAHGFSFSSSVAYQWQVPNSNWFVEPSAGVIISRTKVDPFNFVTAGTPPPLGGDNLSANLQLNDINSDIGRVGLRVGTTIDSGNVVWQPFGAFSVWHEFGSNVTSNFVTNPGTVAIAGIPSSLSATSSTSNFGTYEQYSLGVSAALAGTGWLGFVRVDYRDGPNLQGLSGTGGIRYQFTPDMAVANHAMPVKAPVYKAPVMAAVNWTGLYIGGFGGATQGRADWGYSGGEVSPHVGGYLFGGDIGYNYQIGSYVVGVEADLGKTQTKGAVACGPNSANAVMQSPMFEMTCNTWANWLATATARVGYSWDRALFYVKGGAAWTDEQFSATCNNGPNNAVMQAVRPVPLGCTNPANAFSNGFAASTGRSGWVIGWGTEFALTRNWSAKAEADYISFGDTTVTASDGSALKVGMHLWEEKIGVNYRFNTGP